MGSYFGPPTPAYNNLPIHSDYFKPSRFVISGITLGLQTTVQTSVDHDYVIGQLLRFLIPPTFGTRQLNEQSGYVTSIPAADEVVINLDSRQFDPFIPNPSYGPTSPQVLAIGDINTPSANASGNLSTTTTIQGAFQNISPQ